MCQLYTQNYFSQKQETIVSYWYMYINCKSFLNFFFPKSQALVVCVGSGTREWVLWVLMVRKLCLQLSQHRYFTANPPLSDPSLTLITPSWDGTT